VTQGSRVAATLGWRPKRLRRWVGGKTQSDQTAIRRQIDTTDRRIDQLVYELYGRSNDEIRIVEEAATTPSGLS
jgi:hypothetical protein